MPTLNLNGEPELFTLSEKKLEYVSAGQPPQDNDEN